MSDFAHVRSSRGQHSRGRIRRRWRARVRPSHARARQHGAALHGRSPRLGLERSHAERRKSRARDRKVRVPLYFSRCLEGAVPLSPTRRHVDALLRSIVSLAGEVCLWDIRLPDPIRTIQAHQGGMTQMTVHEHAPIFATYALLSLSLALSLSLCMLPVLRCEDTRLTQGCRRFLVGAGVRRTMSSRFGT